MKLFPVDYFATDSTGPKEFTPKKPISPSVLDDVAPEAASSALTDLGLIYTTPELVTALTPGHAAIRELALAAEQYLLPPQSPQGAPEGPLPAA